MYVNQTGRTTSIENESNIRTRSRDRELENYKMVKSVCILYVFEIKYMCGVSTSGVNGVGKR